MTAGEIAQSYRYAFPSSLRRRDSGVPLLTLATSGGVIANPYFYQGRMLAPRRAADLMLAVAQVARSRFYVPPGMLTRILAAADPVVTSQRGCLRFESLSACCGIYVRLDLLPEALEGDVVGTGTTNVDFNPEMRAALAQLASDEKANLAVGADEFELRRESGAVVERKVPLPSRWLKGFVEVTAYQAAMSPVFDLEGGGILRFLRTLPRAPLGSGVKTWVQAAGGTARVSMRDGPGAVAANGIERLRMLEGIARDARRLRVYSSGGTSAWELTFPDARFSLVMSAEASRGFSGEGQVLENLVAGAPEASLKRVQSAMHWNAQIDADEISRLSGNTADDVRAAIAALGTRGLVGFDLARSSYFRRELPFDLGKVEVLHPRLGAARELLAAGAVSRKGAEIHVRSDDLTYRVRLQDGVASCTCPWFAKHRGDRGPCKHVLAARLWEQDHGAG